MLHWRMYFERCSFRDGPCMFGFIISFRWKATCTALDIISGCRWMYRSWGWSSSKTPCSLWSLGWDDSYVRPEVWRLRQQHLMRRLMIFRRAVHTVVCVCVCVLYHVASRAAPRLAQASVFACDHLCLSLPCHRECDLDHMPYDGVAPV